MSGADLFGPLTSHEISAAGNSIDNASEAFEHDNVSLDNFYSEQRTLRECSKICLYVRAGFSLTPRRLGRSFACRSEALTKAFLLTPCDTDVSGA